MHVNENCPPRPSRCFTFLSPFRAVDKNRPFQALRQGLHANSRRMRALGDHFAAAKAGAMTAIKHDPSVHAEQAGGRTLRTACEAVTR